MTGGVHGWDATLRLRLTEDIAECYVRAALAHMHAMQAHDPVAKQELLEMEQRFISMARNYEFAERLSAFTVAVRQRHEVAWPHA